MAGEYETRIGEAMGWDWPGFGSEAWARPFGGDLDAAVAAGAITTAQADAVYDIAVAQGDDAADAALRAAITANRQAAGVPTVSGAPVGLPVGVPAAAPAAPSGRGRIATMTVRQMPGGQVQLVSSRQGGVALYAQDLAAVKRVKRVEKKLRRVFPRRPRKRKVMKQAGTAIV